MNEIWNWGMAHLPLVYTSAIICFGIFLFVREAFSIDTTSILIMALLIVSGVLSPEEGFAGFNHPAPITLACLFVISGAVFRTGVLGGIATFIARKGQGNSTLALFLVVLVTALFSSVVSDSAVVAMLLPVVLKICRDTGNAPSKFLIPLSYAALLGGVCTLIGTTTNILVSGIMEQKYGMKPFGMFEFTVPALMLTSAGIAYIMICSRWLLPNRGGGTRDDFGKVLSNYITRITIPENCPDKNVLIQKSRLKNDFGADILQVVRDGEIIYLDGVELFVRAGDVMQIKIAPQNLERLRAQKGYKISPAHGGELDSLSGDDHKLYEMVVPQGSDLVNTTLEDSNFRQSYRASVLAIRHREEVMTNDISSTTIREGDLLLVLTDSVGAENLKSQNQLFTISEHKEQKVDMKKAIPAVVIALGVIISASMGMKMEIAGLIGTLLIVMFRVIKPSEAYDLVEWKVIFMVAGVLSMGVALEKSGGAKMIGDFIQLNMGGLDPRITLAGLFFFTFLTTNVLSAKATAALMTPIVINIATAMQISPRPLLIGIMFASSLTFMTPMSYPTNMMVYAPGNYKFNDFLKFGTPLNILIAILASLIIPWFFPF